MARRIIEKAWAKVKGSYGNADGGFIENGIRSLTGAPVFQYYTKNMGTLTSINEAFQIMTMGEKLHYIMGAATSGIDD